MNSSVEKKKRKHEKNTEKKEMNCFFPELEKNKLVQQYKKALSIINVKKQETSNPGWLHIYYDHTNKRIVYKSMNETNNSADKHINITANLKEYTMNDAILNMEERRSKYRDFYNELNGANAYENMYCNYDYDIYNDETYSEQE